MKIIVSVLALLATITCLGQSPAAPASLEATEAIARLRTGLIDSFVKADIDALVTHLDPDVVVTWQNGEVCHGPDQVRAYYQKMMKGDHPIVREVKANPEVTGRHVYGDWAVSWGELHDHFILADGSDLPFNTRFTATIAKRGDRWLVTGFHASVNAFDNPVLALAVHKAGQWAGVGGLVLGVLVGFLVGWRVRKA